MQDATQTPNLAIQHQLEILLSKNQTIPRIEKEIKKYREVLDIVMSSADIDKTFGYAFMVQLALHRRCSVETMIGLMFKHFHDAQTTAHNIEKAVNAGLASYDPVSEKLITKYSISNEIQMELDKFQYPLPMVVEPNKLEKNTDSAYILNSGSVILKNNSHGNDVWLDHLNKMNSIPLTIDMETATAVQNKWKNIDNHKPGETEDDFAKRRRAWEKFNKTSYGVLTVLDQIPGPIYLTHKYDKRGRIYCQGYHVNYQGTDWSKAIVQLHAGEPLHDTCTSAGTSEPSYEMGQVTQTEA